MSDTSDPTDVPERPQDTPAPDEDAAVETPTPIAPAPPASEAAPPVQAAPSAPEPQAAPEEPAAAPVQTEAEAPSPDPMDEGGEDEPPKKSNLSTLLIGGLGCGCLAIIIAGVIGVFSYIKYQEEEEAKQAKVNQAAQQMTQAWQKLQFYKTNKSANADQPNLVVEANSLARSANTVNPTDDALAAIALTQVWANRWHLMPKDQYNASLWSQDDAFTKSTVEKTGQPAAHLARSLTLAYGCLLQGTPDPSNGTCSAAEAAFSKAKTSMGGAPGWLRFELVWIEADFWNQMAWYAYGKRKKDTAKRYWSRVRDVCNAPIESMASAPVNDEELIEACLHASGGLADYESWLNWARALRDDDIKDHRRTRSNTLKTIFRSALPKCKSPRLKLKSLRGRKNFPRIDPYKNPAHPFCAKAGLIATGCPYVATEFNNWRYQTPQYEYNWAQLDRAARTYSSTHPCYLNK